MITGVLDDVTVRLNGDEVEEDCVRDGIKPVGDCDEDVGPGGDKSGSLSDLFFASCASIYSLKIDNRANVKCDTILELC